MRKINLENHFQLKLNSSLIVIFLSIIFSSTTLADSMKNMRGQRYCEILLSVRSLPTEFQIYNTIGLDACPEELWKKIDTQSVQKATGAAYVRLNGPRYWIIDGIENSTLANPTVKTFGGIAMRDAGTLELRLKDIMRGNVPYLTHPVQRNTTWFYAAGKPIYELIDAKGKRYVMQSYSIQNVNQSQASLSQLGEKLKLPKDWQFQTRVLKHDAHLTPVNMKAIVVEDEFLNTYQQETPEFISESNQ